ncbi:hypothetical protein ACVWXL_006112 [Bradyrhizobium sp. GM22.5]
MNEVQNFLFGPPIAGQYKGLSQTMLKGLRARAFHILHREPLALLACILLLPLPSAIPSPGGLESSNGSQMPTSWTLFYVDKNGKPGKLKGADTFTRVW